MTAPRVLTKKEHEARVARAGQLILAGRVTRIAPGEYRIASFAKGARRETVRYVNLHIEQPCPCDDSMWRANGGDRSQLCKHVLAARMMEGDEELLTEWGLQLSRAKDTDDAAH